MLFIADVASGLHMLVHVALRGAGTGFRHSDLPFTNQILMHVQNHRLLNQGCAQKTLFASMYAAPQTHPWPPLNAIAVNHGPVCLITAMVK